MVYPECVMKVTCSHCLTVYNIPENKLKKEVSKTTCRKCGYRIEIRRPTGVVQIQKPQKTIENFKATPPVNNINEILSNAVPKRILDDERTHLDESRIEQPRSEVQTNLAFGPEPSVSTEEEKTKEVHSDLDGYQNPNKFSSVEGNTVPSIGSKSSFSDKLPNENTIPIEDENNDLEFRLDLAMIFCANILCVVGLVLMVVFQKNDLFLHATSIAILGTSMSIFLSLSSRFGTKEASLILCTIAAIFTTCIFLIFGVFL